MIETMKKHKALLIIAAAGLGTTLFLEYRNTNDEK